MQFDRDTALAMADTLAGLGVNVSINVIADPSVAPVQVNPDGSEPELPVYQLDLSRNVNLDATKIAEIADALVPHAATVQIPSMTVASTDTPAQPDPTPVDPNAGGGTVDPNTGDVVVQEPAQPQPVDPAPPAA